MDHIFTSFLSWPPWDSLFHFDDLIHLMDLFPQLTVDTAACHINLRVKAPLEIGTIPLQGEQTDPGQVPVVPPVVNTVETSFQPLASTNTSRAQFPTGKFCKSSKGCYFLGGGRSWIRTQTSHYLFQRRLNPSG